MNGSGPVDLWFNDRLRKESRMSGNDGDMFDGELPVIWSGACPKVLSRITRSFIFNHFATFSDASVCK